MGAAVPDRASACADLQQREVFIPLEQYPDIDPYNTQALQASFCQLYRTRINPNNSFVHGAADVSVLYIVLYPISALPSWLSRMLMRLVGARMPIKNAPDILSETSTTISRRYNSVDMLYMKQEVDNEA